MMLLFVGLPLDALPSLGLSEPTISQETSEVRIGLPAGGVAVLEIAATEEEAQVLFDRRLRTGATHWPTSSALPTTYDQVAGDGAAILLVRERNAVLFVRDLGNDASTITTALVGALTTDPARCARTTCAGARNLR
jgi:hypothetical protein